MKELKEIHKNLLREKREIGRKKRTGKDQSEFARYCEKHYPHYYNRVCSIIDDLSKVSDPAADDEKDRFYNLIGL